MTHPQVINCHWVGGSNKLPPNTVYIGRPGPYGNPYSSKSGQYTKEECIALHRIHLYQSLHNKVITLDQLISELKGKDLACWCKQPKRIVGCHGDTYLHILKDSLSVRDYTKSPISYLMMDLRSALKALKQWIVLKAPFEHFMWLDIRRCDMCVEIDYALFLAKYRKASLSAVELAVARMIVDIELAVKDTDPSVIDYRMHHAQWIGTAFYKSPGLLGPEPIHPHIPIKNPKLKS